MENKNESKTIRTAHSNFRHGMSDYNDGANLTHHLGNDDYKNGNNLTEPYLGKDEDFDGSEALGNDLTEDCEVESYEESEEENKKS